MRKIPPPVLLVGAQAIGQLSLLVAIPVLTRAFSPSELGKYQIAMAVALVLQPLATLRVEFVLPVSKSADSAFSLVKRATISTALIVGLMGCSSLIVLFLGYRGASSTIGMTGVLLVVYAWMAVDNAVLIRSRLFNRLAARNLIAGVLSGLLQLVVAITTGWVFALALAMFVGRLITILVTRAPGAASSTVGDGIGSVKYGPRRALVTISGGLLGNTVLQALTLLSGSILGQAAAGHVGMAQRVSGAPASMIGQGIGQSVQSSVALALNSGEPALTATVTRIGKKLIVIGGLVAVAMATLGPLLAVPVLGDEWARVGPILVVLALPVGLQLAVSPLNSIFVMIDRARVLLVLQLGRLLLSVFAASVVGVVTGDLLWLVSAFALATSLAYIVNAFLLAKCIRRHDLSRSADADAEPEVKRLGFDSTPV